MSKFFVYIIESPSEEDFYTNTSEGEILSDIFSLEGINNIRRVVVSKKFFLSSIESGLADSIFLKNFIPVLHISVHANEEGIGFTNKEVLSWVELKNCIKPLNKAFEGFLLLSMSCCQGFSGSRMAMQVDNELPFYSMVSNMCNINWTDSAIAYSTFYHHLEKGSSVQDSVKAMRIASKNDFWVCSMAEQIQKDFLSGLYKLNPSTLGALIRCGNLT